MREIFYGAAIQGVINREERADINKRALDLIREEGFTPVSEHTAGRDKEETAALLKQAIGDVPEGQTRSSFIRRAMLDLIDGSSGIIFEASIPSIGTGIEIDHACTRAERGLPTVPILTLYQEGYWPSGLSTMVRGIEEEELPNFRLITYRNMEEFDKGIKRFLQGLPTNELDDLPPLDSNTTIEY